MTFLFAPYHFRVTGQNFIVSYRIRTAVFPGSVRLAAAARLLLATLPKRDRADAFGASCPGSVYSYPLEFPLR